MAVFLNSALLKNTNELWKINDSRHNLIQACGSQNSCIDFIAKSLSLNIGPIESICRYHVKNEKKTVTCFYILCYANILITVNKIVHKILSFLFFIPPMFYQCGLMIRGRELQ